MKTLNNFKFNFSLYFCTTHILLNEKINIVLGKITTCHFHICKQNNPHSHSQGHEKKKEEFGKKARTAIVMNDRLPCTIEKLIYEKLEGSKFTPNRMHGFTSNTNKERWKCHASYMAHIRFLNLI